MKLNMKSFAAFMAPAAMLMLGACHKTDDASTTTDNTTLPETFNYRTTKNVEISLSAVAGTEKRTGAVVYVCLTKTKNATDGLPYVYTDTVAAGTIDADGKYDAAFQIPASADSVFAVTSFPTLKGEVALAVAKSTDGSAVKLTADMMPIAASWNQRTAASAGTCTSNNPKFAVFICFDGDGVPVSTPGKTLPQVSIPNQLLTDIYYTLPEGKNISATPDRSYLLSDKTDLILKDSAAVYITFITEAAGNRNSLGYFTYDKRNVPTSATDYARMIVKPTILFENTSLPGSGGNLPTGATLKIGNFGKNTGIGWLCASNAWNGGPFDLSAKNFWSQSSWNPDDAGYKQHMVLMADTMVTVAGQKGIYVIGFEDLQRPNGSDNDFNDILFYVRADPFSAVDNGVETPILTAKDTDKDGVNDDVDDYPNDKDRAHDNYSPGKNKFGTLAYEDLWPAKGDYDMNDLVIGYNHNTVTNAANKVVEVKSKFKVRAIGAGFNNGFGIQFDAAPSAIKSVTLTKGTDAMRAVSASNETSVATNGVEAGTTDGKASVIIFNQALKMVKTWGTGKYFNTESGTSGTSDTLGLTITFNSNLSVSQLGQQPYNPFIFVNHNRKVEVHLPDYKPTSLADLTKLGTSDDKSSVNTGRYYKSTTNMPFALHTLTDFQYPSETSSITKAYSKFSAWAASSGTQYTDWYTNTGSGYRNSGLIYTK